MFRGPLNFHMPRANLNLPRSTFSSSIVGKNFSYSAASAALTTFKHNSSRHIPYLPKVIFAENYLDPATPKIMADLTPELLKIGYKKHLDVVPEKFTIEKRVEQLSQEIKLFDKISADFQSLQLNLKKAYDVEKYIRIKLFMLNAIKTQPQENRQKMLALVENLSILIEQHEAILSNKQFLENLIKHQVEIKFIDVDIPETTDALEKMLLINHEREEHFVKTYLNDNDSLFGRMGAFHIRGFQGQLLEKLPGPVAAASYHFIYLHSKDPIPSEEAIRNPITPYPLGLESIDVTKRDKEKIIEQIVQQIVNKRNLLAELKGKTNETSEQLAMKPK